MILARAPLVPEARRIIAAGIPEIQFPPANEHYVLAYLAELTEARDLLIRAGVAFGVADLDRGDA